MLPLVFQCRRTCYLCYIVKSPGASRPKHSKISFWTKKQLLPGRCCVFRVAGAAFGSEMGPLVWRFKTCSVITCCRQVVLLEAFAPWFSWHQRLTCRQAAAFPGSDLGASELVVSSRVPKCLHRIGSFGPPKRGSKSKASNQAAFIGLSCIRETVWKQKEQTVGGSLHREHRSATRRIAVVGIQSNQCAFCAILEDGDTLVWGDRDAGGLGNGQIRGSCGVCEVQSTERAFAALTYQGTVIAWSDPHYGACMKEAVGELNDPVVAIQATPNAFVAVMHRSNCGALRAEERSVFRRSAPWQCRHQSTLLPHYMKGVPFTHGDSTFGEVSCQRPMRLSDARGIQSTQCVCGPLRESNSASGAMQKPEVMQPEYNKSYEGSNGYKPTVYPFLP